VCKSRTNGTTDEESDTELTDESRVSRRRAWAKKKNKRNTGIGKKPKSEITDGDGGGENDS